MNPASWIVPVNFHQTDRLALFSSGTSQRRKKEEAGARQRSSPRRASPPRARPPRRSRSRKTRAPTGAPGRGDPISLRIYGVTSVFNASYTVSVASSCFISITAEVRSEKYNVRSVLAFWTLLTRRPLPRPSAIHTPEVPALDGGGGEEGPPRGPGPRAASPRGGQCPVRPGGAGERSTLDSSYLVTIYTLLCVK